MRAIAPQPNNIALDTCGITLLNSSCTDNHQTKCSYMYIPVTSINGRPLTFGTLFYLFHISSTMYFRSTFILCTTGGWTETLRSNSDRVRDIKSYSARTTWRIYMSALAIERAAWAMMTCEETLTSLREERVDDALDEDQRHGVRERLALLAILALRSVNTTKRNHQCSDRRHESKV